MRSARIIVGIAAGTLLAWAPALAAVQTFTLEIKAHRFVPDELRVPSGEKFKLIVRNQDKTAEEFESYELNREKIIGGGSSATIFLGPLRPGTYPFFGDFHQETAQGVLRVEQEEKP